MNTWFLPKALVYQEDPFKKTYSYMYIFSHDN